jgi:hypothetical protein
MNNLMQAGTGAGNHFFLEVGTGNLPNQFIGRGKGIRIGYS